MLFEGFRSISEYLRGDSSVEELVLGVGFLVCFYFLHHKFWTPGLIFLFQLEMILFHARELKNARERKIIDEVVGCSCLLIFCLLLHQ